MTRLPQPGGRHLTTGPQLGPERRCVRRLKVPFTHATFRAMRLRAPRIPCRSIPHPCPRDESLRVPAGLRDPTGAPRAPRIPCSALPAQPRLTVMCVSRRPEVCVTRRHGPQFLGAEGPVRVPCPPPGSLAAAPTRPTSHVAARHFVWRGRRGCLITRGGRSMRTGGGVGLPGRRPLPAIHTPCSASRASTRCGLRVPARSGASAGAPLSAT